MATDLSTILFYFFQIPKPIKNITLYGNFQNFAPGRTFLCWHKIHSGSGFIFRIPIFCDMHLKEGGASFHLHKKWVRNSSCKALSRKIELCIFFEMEPRNFGNLLFCPSKMWNLRPKIKKCFYVAKIYKKRPELIHRTICLCKISIFHIVLM